MSRREAPWPFESWPELAVAVFLVLCAIAVGWVTGT